jgi:hypothetical protein
MDTFWQLAVLNGTLRYSCSKSRWFSQCGNRTNRTALLIMMANSFQQNYRACLQYNRIASHSIC